MRLCASSSLVLRLVLHLLKIQDFLSLKLAKRTYYDVSLNTMRDDGPGYDKNSDIKNGPKISSSI